jgi:hypothetical protein
MSSSLSFERSTMKTSDIILVLTAFLASAVEAVEALTVVLATGVTRGWRSTLIGAGAALLVLAALIAALGPALASVPISTLRLVVGALLLIFGLQWLRKAILSYYNAINRHEYARAYGYWETPGAPNGVTPVFADFVRGYANTASVENNHWNDPFGRRGGQHRLSGAHSDQRDADRRHSAALLWLLPAALRQRTHRGHDTTLPNHTTCGTYHCCAGIGRSGRVARAGECVGAGRTVYPIIPSVRQVHEYGQEFA